MLKLKHILSLGLTLLSLEVFSQVKEKFDTLDASRVTSDKRYRDDSATQTGLKRLDARELNRGFAVFGTPDLIKTLQSLPGVASGSELMSGLFVHGGDGNDNLFLLDGVPIYQVSHVVGLFSSFNSDIVESVDFYKSGFPARFGGRASSVVSVRTRCGDFNKYHGVFSLGTSDGRIQVEGPIIKGTTSFNFSLRRSWTDILTTPLLWYANNRERRENGERASQYFASFHFSDLNASVSHKFREENILSLKFYAGLDKLPLEMKSPSFYEADSQVLHKGYDNAKVDVNWGNLLASLLWDNVISDDLYLNANAYYSRNYNRVGMDVDVWSWMDKDIYDHMGHITHSNNHILGLNASVVYTPSLIHKLRMGFLSEYKIYFPEIATSFEFNSMANPVDINNSTNSRYDALNAAIYAEDEISLGENFKTSVGARFVYFGIKGKPYFRMEPRISFKAQCTDNTSLRLSYTEMNQFDHSIATSYLDLPTNTWMPSTSIIKPVFSRQVAGSIYSNLPYNLKLTVEGWYKTMEHLYEYGGISSLYPPLDTWENEFTEGRGRSWGMENMLEYSNGGLMASLAYTLSWSQRKFEFFYPEWYADRNDNRHKIDILVNYRFNKKFELYGGWHYHTGSNMTAATYIVTENHYMREIYDKPNNLKLPDYHRLDLGFNWHRMTRKGRHAVFNFSLYNAYCRMNPFFAYIDDRFEIEQQPDGTTKSTYKGKKGVAIGLIPIIPSISYTLRF